MKAFLRASALGLVALCVLIVLGVEGVCRTNGLDWRAPLYMGGVAGLAINLMGFPFMLMMAAMPADGVREGSYWSWWVGGMLARMFAVGVLMHFMGGMYSGYEQGLTLALVAVYMVGMMAEVIWISKRFNAMDKR
jgi:hypothetical protein